MVDSYWRKIDNNIDNLENSIQIAGILLKLKEHETKINNNSNLEKIDTNIVDISSNKADIKQNQKDIESILKKEVYYNKIYFNSIEIKNYNTGLVKIKTIPIKYSFSNNNYIIAINASYKYSSSYKRKNFNNIYQFYNNNNNLFKYISKNHKDSYIDNFEFDLENYTNNISLNIYLESILSNAEPINLYKDDNSFIEIKIYKYANVFKIKENESNIENNTNKINTIETDTNYNTKIIEKMRYTILDETYTISEKSDNKIFEKIFNNKFTSKGLLKIKANFNHNFSRIYTFRNNDDTFKSIPQIDTNFDEFEIDAVDSSNIKISISLADNTFELYQGTVNIKYEDNNEHKIKNIILDKKYPIENVFKNRSNNVKIFETNLNKQFSNDGILKINAKYNYTDNTNFSHVYKFYSNNKRFKDIILNHTNTTIEDVFEIKTIESSQIQIKIYLVNNNGDNRLIKLYGDNIIQIKYIDNINNLKIIENKNNIESLKNKLYMKNLYNEIFYDEKTQIDFNNIFYEKVFNIDASINDFIEVSFKIHLECDSISLLSYIKFKYEIFDQDNNSLFIKSANLNEYKYFSRYIFIDEYLLYNFINNIEKIKLVIRFSQIKTNIIFMYYLKNENLNRLILKHYGNF